MAKTLRCFAIAVFLLLPLLASADEWKKEFAVQGKPDLEVNVRDGSISFNACDCKQVQARVTTERWRIAPGEVQINQRQSGDRIEIEVEVPRRHHWISINMDHHNIHLELTVPRDANLSLHTGDGSIRGGSVRGELRFSSGDGSIELDRLDGRLQATSGDGSIRVSGRFDALDIKTGDGPIDAEVAPGSRISQTWSARSGDGSIHLALPEGFSAELNAQTGDGNITLDYPVQVSGRLSPQRVRGKLNQGGAELELRTGDGAIVVAKSAAGLETSTAR